MLVLGRGRTPVTDPIWEDVANALMKFQPFADGITLVRHGKERIHAQGARLRLTIQYWATDESRPMMVGYSSGGSTRPTLCGNRVLIGPRETWTTDDALTVFLTFYEGKDLAQLYSLRDPGQQYSAEEIREMIRV